MYDLAIRTKGRKWQTIATWACAPDTCLRNAEIMFQKRGLQVDHNHYVHWSRQLRSQKNWAGLSDRCRHFDQAGKEIV